MKWRKWLENWDMTNLKINLKFLEMEWSPQEADKDAAWELYIEMLTRVATQYLEPEYGDEAIALESIHKLFDLTRNIIRSHGRDCVEFTKIATVVLNQVIRPFTARWHKFSLSGAFKIPEKCEEFRRELSSLQKELRKYGVAGKQHRHIITNAALAWQSMAFPTKDLMTFENIEQAQSEIAFGFKFPAPLLNKLKGTTFSNVKESEKNLFVNSIIPDEISSLTCPPGRTFSNNPNLS